MWYLQKKIWSKNLETCSQYVKCFHNNLITYQDASKVFKIHLFPLLNCGRHFLFFLMENPLFSLPVTASRFFSGNYSFSLFSPQFRWHWPCIQLLNCEHISGWLIKNCNNTQSNDFCWNYWKRSFLFCWHF